MRQRSSPAKAAELNKPPPGLIDKTIAHPSTASPSKALEAGIEPIDVSAN
jgi:hypothetical protein